MRIGVISDTHKVLFAHVRERLRGVDHIIHAGDIGSEQVLRELRGLAPVSAVTGNHDWGTSLDERCPRELTLTFEGCVIYVTHIGQPPLHRFYAALPEPRPHVVIYGHTHRPLREQYQDVLFLNPGSASFPRGTMFGVGHATLSVALLHIEAGRPRAELVLVT
jgi:uncharacterized protein